jgi:hypothetical protein
MMFFLSFTHLFYLIKDWQTRHTFLHNRCENGLYPIPVTMPSSGKMCFYVLKPSTLQWHDRLGHPSFKIVSKGLHTNDLPSVSNKQLSSHVCDACQQAKSHQLPFPTFVSVSKTPLELVFFDVWGLAPASFGNNCNYVSLIDDFSKFTWIYFLKHKSNVFQKFMTSKPMLNTFLIASCWLCKRIGVVNTTN